MSATIRSYWTTARDGWNSFFFSETRPDALALIRIFLCAAVLIPVASRWPDAREIYSTDGVATPMAECYPGAMELPVLNGNAAVIAYTVVVFCLLTGLIGWQTRTSLAIAALGVIYFGLIDYASTLTKYTVIATHGLAILAFANSGAAWSVDAALDGDISGRSVRIPKWSIRVIQLFLALLYFATAVTKVRTPEYITGEHTIFWMQTNMNFAHPVGFWLSTHPILVVISSLTVVLWETVFPLLCWNRIAKGPLLAIGVLFHVTTYLLIGLAVFPLIMLSFYPAFLSSNRARAVFLTAQQWLQWRVEAPSLRWAGFAWAFPVALGLVIVSAVEAEYRLDPLGMRHSKPTLPEIPSAVALERLEETAPARPADYIWKVGLGDRSFANVVRNGNASFGPLDSPMLQVWCHAPHPDIFVHVDVVDDAEMVRMSDGLIITRGELRAIRPFALAGTLAPGNYAFVIRDDVGLIARRPFRVED